MDPFDLRRWEGFSVAGGDPSHPAIIHAVSCDSRTVAHRHTLFVALGGKRQNGHYFLAEATRSGASYALVRPETTQLVPGLTLLRVADPLAAFQEIARCYRQDQPAKVLAITGSYGKTLTKDLLVHLLKQRYKTYGSPESFNSQLGVALSLFGITGAHDLAIIEAGVSRPGEMSRLAWMIQPDYALLTCVEEAHLATMSSLETLLEEKLTLLRAVPSQGWVVAPATTTLKAPVHCWEETLLPTLPVYFPHFPLIAKRAFCAARQLGLSSEEAATALSTYIPEPMRTEVWRSPLGALLINDCYCADPHSISNALRLADYHSQGGPCYFLMDSTLRQLTDNSAPQSFSSRQEAFDALRQRDLSHSCILIKGSRREPLDQLSETFSEGLGDNRLYIHLDAIRHNVEALQRHLGGHIQIMAMLKARAYGTDPLMLARFLSRCGIRLFGLAHVSEAVRLRLNNIQDDLFVISCAPYEAPQIARWNLQVGVASEATIKALEQQRQAIKVHINVDTGMGRLGCHPDEALQLAKQVDRANNLQLEGIMTHLASAESPDHDSYTLRQLEQFHSLVVQLKAEGIEPPLKHVANSSTALRFNVQGTNLVRLGLALYGLHASPATREALSLRPALTLTSRLASIHTHKRGDTIGYGRTYEITRSQERIGVVPLGYFDGIHRHHSNRSHVVIRNKLAPICGSVCMDYLTVNLTDVSDAKVHDNITLFGHEKLSAESFAEPESPYQLITCLGPRIQRVLIYEAQAREYVLA